MLHNPARSVRQGVNKPPWFPTDPFGLGQFYYSWRLPRALPTHYSNEIPPWWAKSFFEGHDSARDRSIAELKRGVF